MALATPLSADAETAGGVITRLIERNTTIPKKRSQQTDRHQGRSGELLRPARRRLWRRDLLIDAQGHQVGGSVRQGLDFARSEQHHEPRVPIRLAVEQGFHLPGCHVCGAAQAASLAGKASSQVRDFCWCWTSLHWSRASETAGVPIKRNTTIPECRMYVINMSENPIDTDFSIVEAFFPVGVVRSR